MDITINELLQGKSTIIKNKNYFPTKSYAEPFLEQMSKYTDDFRISVKLPDQLTTLEGDTDITYNRVLIQAVMPDEFYDNHREVVGFLYGLEYAKNEFNKQMIDNIKLGAFLFNDVHEDTIAKERVIYQITKKIEVK